MNANINFKIISSLLVLAAPAAWAQDLTPAAAESPNRFGLNYRMGFNTKVNFKNLGGFTMPTRLTPDGTPYNYSDGYVYPSAFTGAPGLTWNWGYDAAPAPYKQYTIGDPNVVFHKFSSSANASSTGNEDTPQSNFELTYNRELLRGKGWRAGLEAAGGYGWLSIHDSRPLAADVNVASDAYVVPIDPQTGYGITKFAEYPGPHQGNYQGPTYLLGDEATPLRSQVVPGGASITGSRHFDADLVSFRFGPYLEFPLSKKVTAGLSGGFALVYVSSKFSFNETVSIPGVGSASAAGSGSHSGWLPGGYVAANISLALSEKWALVAGAQFEDVGQYTQNLYGKQATLDLRDSIFVTIGLSYSF